MKKVWGAAPQFLAVVLLLWALKPHHSYAYFVFLRWACCAAFVSVAVYAYLQGKCAWVCALGIIAVVYNPIIPIHLARGTWSTVNLITIGVAVTSVIAFNLKDLQNRQSALRLKRTRPPPDAEDKNPISGSPPVE